MGLSELLESVVGKLRFGMEYTFCVSETCIGFVKLDWARDVVVMGCVCVPRLLSLHSMGTVGRMYNRRSNKSRRIARLKRRHLFLVIRGDPLLVIFHYNYYNETRIRSHSSIA